MVKEPLKFLLFIFLDLLFQSNCRVCSLTIWNMHKHNACIAISTFLYLHTFNNPHVLVSLCIMYSTFDMNTLRVLMVGLKSHTHVLVGTVSGWWNMEFTFYMEIKVKEKKKKKNQWEAIICGSSFNLRLLCCII